MRKFNAITVMLALCVAVSVNTLVAGEGEKNVNSDMSTKLVNDINSKVMGVQEAAMQRVIENKDKVDVKDAIPELLHIYRNHKNEQFRHLALVTIHATKNKQAMEMLKNDVKYEKSPVIKSTLVAILKDYENNFAFFDQSSKPVLGSR